MSRESDDAAWHAVFNPADPVADTATLKQITRNLFGTTNPEPEPEPDQHLRVRAEGANPEPAPDTGADVAAWVSDLFGERP
jgi:hypothetical protein